MSRPRDARRQGSPPGRRPVLQTSRVEFNSRALHETPRKCLGCDPGSGGAPNAASGVRLLDDLQRMARESAANGGKRGPNPRDVAEARGVRFFRSPPLARSTSGEVAPGSSKPVCATITCSSSRQGRRALIAETRVQVPHRWPCHTPPANGSRPALRTQASEVRILSGVRATPASSGKPGALMRRAEMVRFHPPVRVGRRRGWPVCPLSPATR